MGLFFYAQKSSITSDWVLPTTEIIEPKKAVLSIGKAAFCVVKIIKNDPALTLEQIGEAIGIGRTSVYKVVKSLREIGVLERKGRKRDGEWVLKL